MLAKRAKYWLLVDGFDGAGNIRFEGCVMAQAVQIEIEMPGDLARFRLPKGVQKRLQKRLDKQDQGRGLTGAEKSEAEGLVDLSEVLSLLRLRAERSRRRA